MNDERADPMVNANPDHMFCKINTKYVRIFHRMDPLVFADTNLFITGWRSPYTPLAVSGESLAT